MMTYAAIVALLLGICLFVSLPRARKWQQVTGVAAFLALIGTVYAGSIDLLGEPKPIRLEWRSMGAPTVLAVSIREGEAIYIWLQDSDRKAPRSYELPWELRTAQQLQKAMEKRAARGGKVRMSGPAASGPDGEGPKFYAEPQPAGPPKGREPDGPLRFRRPGK